MKQNIKLASEMPEKSKIAKLDDFRSIDELAAMLSSCSKPEEISAASRDFASDYSRLYCLAQQLYEKVRMLGQSPDEKDRTIERLTKEIFNLKEELCETRKRVVVDELTGAYRKFVAMIQGPELVAQANRYGLPLSFVMMDIDDFGKYNNKYGHVQGDKALSTIASVMLHSKREPDVLVRYGGEEFLLILPNTDKEGALKFAEGLRQRIAEVVIPVGDERYIKCRDGMHTHRTICAGIFTYERSLNEVLGFYDNTDEMKKTVALIGLADKALYSAKEYVDETGNRQKNRVSVQQV